MSRIKKNSGFTLIEIMMVILVIGFMASLVQFNYSGDRPEDKLKQASERFVGIFDLAAEYALLNNVEIGLIVTDNRYEFLGYDGAHWSTIADQPLLAARTLPEGIELILKLDDLPIEEPPLFNVSAYVKQQKDALENNADDNSPNNTADNKAVTSKKRIPQVYILSGGDISAFSLTFSLSAQVALALADNKQTAYRVTGLYSTPLKIEEINSEGSSIVP